jgi:hypothetical protein
VKVWVYVEGESDRLALLALWTSWQRELKIAGWGIRIMPLDNKAKLLRKIGTLAAEKLVGDNCDLVVALPDLYPVLSDGDAAFRHSNMTELVAVLRNEVEGALKERFQRGETQLLMQRYYPAALKHDLEVLLLAGKDALRTHLGTPRNLGTQWRNPPEDQDQQKPPKYVVEELFRTELKRRYRDTTDAPNILRRTSTQREVLFDERKAIQCPVFKGVVDWIGGLTGVPGY